MTKEEDARELRHALNSSITQVTKSVEGLSDNAQRQHACARNMAWFSANQGDEDCVEAFLLLAEQHARAHKCRMPKFIHKTLARVEAIKSEA